MRTRRVRGQASKNGQAFGIARALSLLEIVADRDFARPAIFRRTEPPFVYWPKKNPVRGGSGARPHERAIEVQWRTPGADMVPNSIERQVLEILRAELPVDTGGADGIPAVAAFVSRYCRQIQPSWITQGFETVTVTRRSVHIKATSVKPQNMILNLGGLLDVAAQGVLVVAGTVSHPWLAPFGILRLWRSLINLASVEIAPPDAVVILALWKARNSEGRSEPGRVREETRLLTAQMGSPEREDESISRSIESLKRLHCVRVLPNAEGYEVIEELVVSNED